MPEKTMTMMANICSKQIFEETVLQNLPGEIDGVGSLLFRQAG